MIRLTDVGLLVLALLPAPLLAQTTMEGGARAAALGGAQTALRDEAAGYANPASWATLSGRAVTFLATQAFALPELRLGAAHYAEPTRFGTLAVGARTFGFDAYRETRLHAGYAAGLQPGTSRSLFVGAQVEYHRVAITNYGSAGTVGVALGLLIGIHPNLDAGIQARNLHAPALNGREELPRTLALGLAYRPHPTVRLLADVYKDVRFPLSVRSGIEVQLVPAFTIRAGAASEPSRLTAGAGLRVGRLFVDLAGEYQEVLGWSPAVSTGLRW